MTPQHSSSWTDKRSNKRSADGVAVSSGVLSHPAADAALGSSATDDDVAESLRTSIRPRSATSIGTCLVLPAIGPYDMSVGEHGLILRCEEQAHLEAAEDAQRRSENRRGRDEEE